METIDQTIAVLARTPAALDALLRGLPDACTSGNEGPGTWSSSDIVGHLIHGERTNWIPRAMRILEAGEASPFEPFDRLAQQRNNRGRPLGDLLDEFARERSASLHTLQALHLQPADLDRRGRHPELGVVTLGQLIASWAAHDLTHLHQLSRVMAHQLRDEVGPWIAFLGVLRCSAHGA